MFKFVLFWLNCSHYQINVDWSTELLVLLHEFKWGIKEYLQNYTTGLDGVSTLNKVVAFNSDYPDPTGYNQELLIQSEATDDLHNQTYVEARSKNVKAAKDYLEFLLTKHKLDTIVAPSETYRNVTNVADLSIHDTVINLFSVAAIAGYPVITVPVSSDVAGVPFGISFVGGPNSERTLLHISKAVESRIKGRLSPKFHI